MNHHHKENVPNYANLAFVINMVSWFYCNKKSLRRIFHRQKKTKGRESVDWPKQWQREWKECHRCHHHYAKIKIIMGTLYNYDLISFMLMAAFISSVCLRSFPLSFDMIVNLYCNLFNGPGPETVTISRFPSNIFFYSLTATATA